MWCGWRGRERAGIVAGSRIPGHFEPDVSAAYPCGVAALVRVGPGLTRPDLRQCLPRRPLRVMILNPA